MPKSPGWYIKKTDVYSNQTSTTGTLTVNIQPETTDNDIMIMHLTHQGPGYAVVPAGWTLITQNVAGTLRGEMYWKRAAAEPANYVITGVGTAAAGFVMSYGGGLLSGNPVDVAISTPTLAGPSSKFLSNGITTTSEGVLLIAACSRTFGANDYFRFTKTFFPINNPTDFDIYIPTRIRDNNGTTNARFGFAHVIKTVPGPTDMLINENEMVTDRVGFIIALKPETGVNTAGTRYYLSCKPPNKHLIGTTKSHWDYTVDSPRNYSDQVPDYDFIFELTQNKCDAGPVYSYAATAFITESLTRGGGNTNIQGEDGLQYRWVTPPLQAQTVSGTLSLVTIALCSYAQGCHIAPYQSIRGSWKVHAYVSVGNSLDVRSVLIDNYVDATAWPQGGGIFQLLTLSLTTQSVQVGDRIVIELGTHILVSSVTPACETLPASNYAQIWLTRGAASVRNPGMSLPGLPDGIVGNYLRIGNEADAKACPHLTFSSTILELADDTPIPPNYTEEAAVVMPVALPYIAPEINTRRVPAANRVVYYKWTPDRTGKVNAVVWKSCYKIWLQAYGPGVDNYSDYYVTGAGGVISRSCIQFSTIAGQEVTFKIRTSLDINGFYYDSPSVGGVLNFAVYYEEPPEDGDVIVAISKFILRYRNDVLVSLIWASSGTAFSGVAIDYTKRPMTMMYEDGEPIHTEDRLYIGFFGSDAIGIYDLATMTLVDWLNDGSDVLNGWFLSSIAMSPAGQLYVGWFGDGFQRIANSDSSYMDQVSLPDRARINSIDGAHSDWQPGWPFPPGNFFPTELEVGGSNYVELNPEGTTLYYTSGGWYTPVGGTKIKRMDAATGAQLPDFATVASTGPNPGLKGLFPMPNDLGVLVCAGARIVRLDKNGVFVQEYTVPNPFRGSSFTDVELCSDAKHFWALDELSNTLYKINLKTGAIVLENWVPVGFGTTTSLVVYRKDAYPPPWKELSGIYYINPEKTHDTYNTDERKIPNPTVKTALIGE